MCGRFTLRASAQTVAQQFSLLDVEPLIPRYNIAPSQSVAVVRVPVDEGAGRRQLAFLRWGLVPSWAEDPAVGNRLINARAETATEKPAFRAAFRRRRCLVPADGFYEWLRRGRLKQPYFFHLRDNGIFAFAGLWEAWQGADNSVLESCTVLTTEPNDLMRPIHNRMPVILPPEAYDVWLDPDQQDPATLRALLAPYPSEALEAYAVSTYVNNPMHDDARCIRPADSQLSMF